LKYTEAWSGILIQNLNLKIATLILGVATIILSTTTLKLIFKEPIVIERGCYSKNIFPSSEKQTPEEMKSFFVESLAQRFDSDVQPTDALISAEEIILRQKEQQELASKKIKQKLLFTQFQETKDGFEIEADRVLSVGAVRSAFSFPLIVKVERAPRSLSNPYGLQVISTTQKNEKTKE
jgi:hypothetical protein